MDGKEKEKRQNKETQDGIERAEDQTEKWRERIKRGKKKSR